MGQILEKIVLSSTPPDNANVIWLKEENGEYTLYNSGNSGWEQISVSAENLLDVVNTINSSLDGVDSELNLKVDNIISEAVPGSTLEVWTTINEPITNGNYVSSRAGTLGTSTAYQFMNFLAVTPGDTYRISSCSGWSTTIQPPTTDEGDAANLLTTSGVAGYSSATKEDYNYRILDPLIYAQNHNVDPILGRTTMIEEEFVIPEGVNFIRCSSAYVPNEATAAVERPLLLEKLSLLEIDPIPEVTVISTIENLNTTTEGLVTTIEELTNAVENSLAPITKATDMYEYATIGTQWFKVYNPYKKLISTKYKGLLHTHTAASDGVGTAASVLAEYDAAGYSFLLITDHDVVTTPADDSATNCKMLFPAYENTHRNQHMVIMNTEGVYLGNPVGDANDILDYYETDGSALISYAHPDYEPAYDRSGETQLYTNFLDLTLEVIDALTNKFHFVEVYNGVVENLNNNIDLNTDTAFLQLLAKGFKMFSLAVDDRHSAPDFDMGWIQVYAEEETVLSYIQNLMLGNYIASSGPEFLAPPVFENNTLTVTFDPALTCKFYSGSGEIPNIVEGSGTASYTLDGTEKAVYAVLSQADGIHGPRRCWSQPLFIETIKLKNQFV